MLPALSTSRPFIAPRMSLGMKVAVGFLALTGVLILSGMVMTLSQIMQRLNTSNQENLIAAAPVEPATTTLASAAHTDASSYPVIGRTNDDRMILPRGAVVQQMVSSAGGVYLLMDVPRDGQRLVVLDAKTGNVRRDIRLQNDGK